MFLDDKLYQHVINRKIESTDDFKAMINELYRMCENHFKPNLHVGMSFKQGTVEMDRVFNSWDLFIKRLIKDNYFLIDILSKPETSFKSAFMHNEALKEIYLKGK